MYVKIQEFNGFQCWIETEWQACQQMNDNDKNTW